MSKIVSDSAFFMFENLDFAPNKTPHKSSFFTIGGLKNKNDDFIAWDIKPVEKKNTFFFCYMQQFKIFGGGDFRLSMVRK